MDNQIDELNQRIIQLMVRLEHSKSSFAKALDVSLPLMTHITSGRNKPGLDLLQRILTQYEQVNPDWLLLGSGDMFRKKAPKPDLTPIYRLLEHNRDVLNQIQPKLVSILNYHKILMEEVNHLAEIDTVLASIQSQLTSVEEVHRQVEAELKLIS